MDKDPRKRDRRGRIRTKPELYRDLPDAVQTPPPPPPPQPAAQALAQAEPAQEPDEVEDPPELPSFANSEQADAMGMILTQLLEEVRGLRGDIRSLTEGD